MTAQQCLELYANGWNEHAKVAKALPSLTSAVSRAFGIIGASLAAGAT
jgi:hypothetical protein